MNMQSSSKNIFEPFIQRDQNGRVYFKDIKVASQNPDIFSFVKKSVLRDPQRYLAMLLDQGAKLPQGFDINTLPPPSIYPHHQQSLDINPTSNSQQTSTYHPYPNLDKGSQLSTSPFQTSMSYSDPSPINPVQVYMPYQPSTNSCQVPTSYHTDPVQVSMPSFNQPYTNPVEVSTSYPYPSIVNLVQDSITYPVQVPMSYPSPSHTGLVQVPMSYPSPLFINHFQVTPSQATSSHENSIIVQSQIPFDKLEDTYQNESPKHDLIMSPSCQE